MNKKSINPRLALISLFLLLSFFSFNSQAQLFGFDKKEDKKKERKKDDSRKKDKNKDKEEGKAFEVDPQVEVPVTINLEAEEEKEEEEEDEKKEKKRKRNVYYGLKTKKGYTKTGFGNREVITLFHYLKDYQDPNPYIRDVYWYDTESDQIKKSYNVDEEHARILHGPYKRMLGDQVIEKGTFYIGTKHGRWTEYNKNDILMDKEEYVKGWPKQSRISYYGREGNKVKEVIPIEFGKKEGYYYYFFENGQVSVIGEYQLDEKVGVWREYYKNIKKRKKEIQYREDPFNDDFSPFVLREWNKKGEVMYKSEKALEE